MGEQHRDSSFGKNVPGGAAAQASGEDGAAGGPLGGRPFVVAATELSFLPKADLGR